MYTTEGIVLKKRETGEADLVFTIFTKDYGKIRAVAQGVRKEGAKLKGFLEPFNLVSVGMVLGRNGERLTYGSLLHPLFQIRQSYEKLSALWYITELVERGCMAGQKDPELWQLLVKSLLWLEQAPDQVPVLKNFLNTFEKEFLKALGFDSGSDFQQVLNFNVARPF